ncbi:MAG: hypothetical protein KKF77_11240 [Proteobacteria bacterium]|nr:hypothetical protein [Pseudomonadota bacterium]
MKKALVTTCLSLVMLLAVAASGYASVWTATDGVGTTYVKPTSLTPGSNAWSSGPVEVSASALAGLSNLLFTFDYIAVGSWDSVAGTKPDKQATVDHFFVSIFNGVDTLTYESIVDQNLPTDSQAVHLEYLLPKIAGTYVFQAIGQMTATDEKWILSGASLGSSSTPTPVPGAVWMLGSGLLGLMGFKRARKNAA